MTEGHQRIYSVAQRLFALRGYAGVSIADIAKEAKMAKSTVLHHFANKQRLYQEVVNESIALFAAAPAELAHATLADKLKHLLAAMLAEPMHAKLLNRVFMDNPKSAALAARRYWRPLLEQLTPNGDLHERALALFCVNAIIQIAFSIELQRHVLKTEIDLVQTYRGVIDDLVLKVSRRETFKT
ncbi:TetR/AcrR family transcriptional regulator [Turneriella parva]|uniref:Transcriptional regulator, TetR family n=1 Tax=Turneriella parva (strain ATCC BAA-1111 / DSM 21527 / NCTC 11395 / H) TaxID=869212 RepID=I4B1M1_TURPD|nr:TetR/AcrR family transcriptional regulator [Turneriella parva]AFM11178.1 transcriptional regulator, TetR family [Turneriella parva DSM 21527]